MYGTQLDDYPDDELNETSVTAFRRREPRDDSPTSTPSATVCLDRHNAFPPEDCGGPGGYAELLRVPSDPWDEGHDYHLEWVGGSFDFEAFDLAETNIMLQRLR